MTLLKMDFVLRVNSNTGRVLSVLDSATSSNTVGMFGSHSDVDSEDYEEQYDLAVDTVRTVSVEVDVDDLEITEEEFREMTEAERRPYVFEAALRDLLPMGDDSDA